MHLHPYLPLVHVSVCACGALLGRIKCGCRVLAREPPFLLSLGHTARLSPSLGLREMNGLTLGSKGGQDGTRTRRRFAGRFARFATSLTHDSRTFRAFRAFHATFRAIRGIRAFRTSRARFSRTFRARFASVTQDNTH
eukprot:6744022-Prymnesium_polylepis.1